MNTYTDNTEPAPAASLSIFRLIATYWEAYDRLDIAMQETDAVKDGTPEREAAEQKQFTAGDELDKAACAVCAYVPIYPFEARIKADFVAALARENGGTLDREWTSALLPSLPTLYDPKREAKA